MASDSDGVKPPVSQSVSQSVNQRMVWKDENSSEHTYVGYQDGLRMQTVSNSQDGDLVSMEGVAVARTCTTALSCSPQPECSMLVAPANCHCKPSVVTSGSG